MSTEATFKQTAALDIIEAGEGFVLYDEPRDRVHFLNPTAAVIYELCEDGRSLSEIARALSDGFALETPPIDEVRQCLESLEAERLIHRL